jgi:thymidylate synthase (FAD)
MIETDTQQDTLRLLFNNLGGTIGSGFPAIHSAPRRTPAGTPYLTAPGVVMLAKPEVNLSGLRPFLEGFDPNLKFGAYADDPTSLDPGAQLVKVAGQTCYASFGETRTMNADAARYIKNLIDSGHTSVLEHATVTALFYGISRSLSHEWVRHRAGWAYSQLSQRFVSGRVLRFVERPEYQEDSELHALFEARIDRASREYQELAKRLLARQRAGAQILSAEARTDLRKKVQQTARSLLPNETETILVATANARAWRWVLAQRGSAHAETEIRALAVRALLCLQQAAPLLFADLRVVPLADGTLGVHAEHPKP